MSSLFRYFGEQGGPGTPHRDFLHWPGTASGFPVRGQVNDLKDEEYLDIPHTLDFHSKRFRLWDPADKAEYDQIRERIANGWYMLQKEHQHWNTEHEAPVYWLEWVQIYGENVNGKRPGAPPGGNTFLAQPGTAEAS